MIFFIIKFIISDKYDYYSCVTCFEKVSKTVRDEFCRRTFAVSLGLTYWIPNMIFETFRVQVPVWYLLNQEIFVSAIVGGCLSYLTCFYR